jgi:N-acetylneuraminic acid mutarotase
MTTHFRTRNITFSVYALAQASSRLASRGRWIALCLALAFTLCAASISATAQSNEWTWMGGSSSTTGSVPGVYGTLRTPAPGNIPGRREGAVTWTDSSGHLWLFGGDGYDANGNFGELNDLWEFNPSLGTYGEWTWMGGSSTLGLYGGQKGVYGTLGVPAVANVPGSRDAAISWTDTSGNFWLFGGSGEDANSNYGELNDLWKFNPSTYEWAWMGGSSTMICTTVSGVQYCGNPGVYGTLGVAATGNIPGGRYGAVSWTDSSGNLWLFGGAGYYGGGEPATPEWYNFNDLWKFNPSTKEWAWMGGSGSICEDDCGNPGVYRTLGVPNTLSIPGSREGAVSWTDHSGNLWLFGGWGFDANGTLGALNDLWEFNPSYGDWTWMGGSSTISCNTTTTYCGQPGVYGTLGWPVVANIPGGREWPVSWIDSNGNLWLFGGDGFDGGGTIGWLNDLWEFNLATTEWTWMGGGSTVPGEYGSNSGVYGTLGVPSVANFPGGRYAALSWTDSSGNFWLSDGSDYGSTSASFFNDLWKYTPPTSVAMPTFTPAGGSSGPPLTVTISDATSGATIYYTTNGTTPTISSSVYSSPITVSATETVEAIAVKAGWINSAVGSATYTIYGQVKTPTFSPAGGSYGLPQTVTISDATSGATIYYTTNGTTPTTSSTVYSGPITVAASETVKAIAVKANWINSLVASATYSGLQAPTPTFTPAGGCSGPPLTMTISDAAPGATIYYTTDGTTPTTSSNLYSVPITVAASETVKAIATATGYSTSSVGSATYIINGPVATPTFSPAGGVYHTAQTVTISDATSGSAIYYTTNNTTPTNSSTNYSTPITVATTETMQAIAEEACWTNSAVKPAAYLIIPLGHIASQAGNGVLGYSGDGGPAASAEFSSPTGVAVDSSGNLYIVDADNNRIRKVTASTGIITTVAGNGTAGYSGDGGAATSAELDTPFGVAVDASGNLYIVDVNNDRIRKVTASTGIITTVAGNGTWGYSGDGGTATSAELFSPFGVAVDASGNLYIADSGNNRIRKVTASTGIITTVAGNGTGGYTGDSGVATGAELNSPYGVAVDASGNIYIVDSGNNRIRKVTASTGVITTMAGNGTAGYSGDSGAGTSAELNSPFGVAVDASGNLYIADTYNLVIRKVTASTGIITTVAGNGTAGSSGDGGAATSAELSYPTAVEVDSPGNVYIADYNNNKVRTVGSISQ